MRSILLAFLAVLFPRTATDSSCTGMGTTAGISLICSGTCQSGTCESHSDGLDVDGAYSYCGCFTQDTDTCCTVVIRDGVARKFGTCPPCGASGSCTIVDNPDGNLNEPVCQGSGKVRVHSLNAFR